MIEFAFACGAVRDGAVIGRIYKANAALVGPPWMWTLAFGMPPADELRLAFKAEGRKQWRPRHLMTDRLTGGLGPGKRR
jgi:hypothetical protein